MGSHRDVVGQVTGEATMRETGQQDRIVGCCDECSGNVIQRPWGSWTCYCLEDCETRTWRTDWERCPVTVTP